MRCERHAELQARMEADGLDGMVLLGTAAVSYATGAAAPATDSGRAALLRSVAVLVRGDEAPHLFTAYPEGTPDDHPRDHAHPAAHPDTDHGAATIAGFVRDVFDGSANVAIDELTHPLARALDTDTDTDTLSSVTSTLTAARLHKTVDEVACIRQAQRINEAAMVEVQSELRADVAQTALSATLLRAAFERGAHGNGLDPIWQAMAPTRAAGPWTFTGGVGYPAPSSDSVLDRGDVVWVDTGIAYAGYLSDFGRTWIVEDTPTPRQEAQFRRWRTVVDAVLELVRPGVTGRALTQAAIDANDGVEPWLDHLYLAHGIGTESAETPLIGTDLGEELDERVVIEPGMVIVFEPVIWDDGAAGYRAEDMVAVTDDGWIPLSDYPYAPYGGAA